MTGPPLVQFLTSTHTVLGLVAVLRLGLHLRRVAVRADRRWSIRSPIRRRRACRTAGCPANRYRSSLRRRPPSSQGSGCPHSPIQRSPRRRAGCRARQVHCRRDASAPSEVQSPICLPGAAEESQQDSASYLTCPRPTRQRAVQGPPLTQSLARSKKLKLSGDSRWLQKVINRARKLMVREKGKDAAALFFGSISIQSPELTKSRVHNGNWLVSSSWSQTFNPLLTRGWGRSTYSSKSRGDQAYELQLDYGNINAVPRAIRGLGPANDPGAGWTIARCDW